MVKSLHAVIAEKDSEIAALKAGFLQGKITWDPFLGGSNLMQMHGSIMRDFPYKSALFGVI